MGWGWACGRRTELPGRACDNLSHDAPAGSAPLVVCTGPGEEHAMAWPWETPGKGGQGPIWKPSRAVHSLLHSGRGTASWSQAGGKYSPRITPTLVYSASFRGPDKNKRPLSLCRDNWWFVAANRCGAAHDEDQRRARED